MDLVTPVDHVAQNHPGFAQLIFAQRENWDVSLARARQQGAKVPNFIQAEAMVTQHVRIIVIGEGESGIPERGIQAVLGDGLNFGDVVPVRRGRTAIAHVEALDHGAGELGQAGLQRIGRVLEHGFVVQLPGGPARKEGFQRLQRHDGEGVGVGRDQDEVGVQEQVLVDGAQAGVEVDDRVVDLIGVLDLVDQLVEGARQVLQGRQRITLGHACPRSVAESPPIPHAPHTRTPRANHIPHCTPNNLLMVPATYVFARIGAKHRLTTALALLRPTLPSPVATATKFAGRARRLTSAIVPAS